MENQWETHSLPAFRPAGNPDDRTFPRKPGSATAGFAFPFDDAGAGPSKRQALETTFNTSFAHSIMDDSLLMPPPSRSPTPSVTNLSRIVANSIMGHNPQTSVVTRLGSSDVTSGNRGVPGVVVALAEGRGKAHGEIGFASLDLRRTEVALGQYADSASYLKTITKINITEPCAVVISETMSHPQKPSPLYTLLVEFYNQGGPNIITVLRKHFNEIAGLDLVKRLRLDSDSRLEAELSSKYYCLSAFAALISFIEFDQKIVFANQTLKIRHVHLEDTCLIDWSTSKNLELVMNAVDSRDTKHSLLGVLDYTKTYGGGRLLRANVLQPFTKVESINMRLECISELIQSEDMFFGLQQILGQFSDVEKIISFLVQIPKKESIKISESHIGSFIHLKHVLGLVDPLRECLKGSQNALFRGFHDLLDDARYGRMMDIVDTLIHPETKFDRGALRMKTQKCYAVKPRINGCLDVARILYSESIDDISALVVQLQEKHNLPTMQLGYDTSRGFHLQLYIGGKHAIALDSLPDEFIHVTRNRNLISFTTKELVMLNGRSADCLKEVFVLSHEMLRKACDSLRPLIGCLYELTECVATIDVIVSLTHACSLADYCRPVFHGALILQQSKHPVLDRIMGSNIVANNIYADGSCNFHIITGANMAGKTTYMKQIALLQIMAQIGSFIPAQFASFPIVEQIFSRFGSEDDMRTNASTFMVEMRDMYHIIQTANNKTLVLIDELGRGTSPEEGVAVCWALCEELLLTGATTLFATHYEEICDLEHLYHNVKNMHFVSERLRGDSAPVSKLVQTHRLDDGSAVDVRYGLALAGSTSFPQSIIEDANELLDRLRKIKFTLGADEEEFEIRQLICRYASRLVQLAFNGSLDYDDIVNCINRIKEQCGNDLNDHRPSSRISRVSSSQVPTRISVTPSSNDQRLSTGEGRPMAGSDFRTDPKHSVDVTKDDDSRVRQRPQTVFSVPLHGNPDPERNQVAGSSRRCSSVPIPAPQRYVSQKDAAPAEQGNQATSEEYEERSSYFN